MFRINDTPEKNIAGIMNEKGIFCNANIDNDSRRALESDKRTIYASDFNTGKDTIITDGKSNYAGLVYVHNQVSKCLNGGPSW